MNLSDHPAVADTMARLTQSFQRPPTTDELVELIVRSAGETIPGVEYAGIAVAHRSGRLETVAVSDPLVREIDGLHLACGEGPVLDAWSSGGPTWTHRLSTDDRWPQFGPRAARLGVESQLSVELYREPRAVGVLHLYATTVAAFDDETSRLAGIFAVHAAHALGHAHREQQLTEALQSRRTIGIALGIVMERYGLDEDRAFGFLARLSQHENIKLHEVAARVVREIHAPRTTTVTPVTPATPATAAPARKVDRPTP